MWHTLDADVVGASYNRRRRSRLNPTGGTQLGRKHSKRPSRRRGHIGVAPSRSSTQQRGTPDSAPLHHDSDTDSLGALPVDSDTSEESSPESPVVAAGLVVPPPRAATSSHRLNKLLRAHAPSMSARRPSWYHLRDKQFVPSWKQQSGGRGRRRSLPDAVPSTLGVGGLATAFLSVIRMTGRAKRLVKARTDADRVARVVTRRRLSQSVRDAALQGAAGSPAGAHPMVETLRTKLRR